MSVMPNPIMDPIPTVVPIQTIGTHLACVEINIDPVLNGATWTSMIRSTDGYVRAVLMGIFDQDGTVYIDQSYDGVNFDYSTILATVANIGFALSAEIIAPYVRFRWANGVVDDTTLNRLYCSLRSEGA